MVRIESVARQTHGVRSCAEGRLVSPSTHGQIDGKSPKGAIVDRGTKVRYSIDVVSLHRRYTSNDLWKDRVHQSDSVANAAAGTLPGR